MHGLLLPLAFAIPALIGTGVQASEDFAWSYTPWATQDLLAQAAGEEPTSDSEKTTTTGGFISISMGSCQLMRRVQKPSMATQQHQLGSRRCFRHNLQRSYDAGRG